MKVFEYFFYVCFRTAAQYFPGEPDYSYGSAIGGGIFFSIPLFLNIMTILTILGCDKIIKIVDDSFGLAGYLLFLLPPFLFIYFSCIYKKKYIKIKERFSYMDKSLKKKLLAVLVGFLYWMGSVALVILSHYYFN